MKIEILKYTKTERFVTIDAHIRVLKIFTTKRSYLCSQRNGELYGNWIDLTSYEEVAPKLNNKLYKTVKSYMETL